MNQLVNHFIYRLETTWNVHNVVWIVNAHSAWNEKVPVMYTFHQVDGESLHAKASTAEPLSHSCQSRLSWPLAAKHPPLHHNHTKLLQPHLNHCAISHSPGQGRLPSYWLLVGKKSSGTNKAVFHLHLLCHGCINGDMSTSEVWYRDNFIVEMYPSYSKRRFFWEEASKRRGKFNCHFAFSILSLSPPTHSLLTERLKHNQMGFTWVSSISKKIK